MEVKINQLKEKAAQCAIDYIKNGADITILRDSFNMLCDAMGTNDYNPDDLSFEIEDIVNSIKQNPWVIDIAKKNSEQRTWDDIERIVEDLICHHWLMSPEEVTTKNVADILKVADPLSHRHIVAQKVAIDCIHALDHDELERLDKVLWEIEKNPNYV